MVHVLFQMPMSVNQTHAKMAGHVQTVSMATPVLVLMATQILTAKLVSRQMTIILDIRQPDP